jgi:hypothetical protein
MVSVTDACRSAGVCVPQDPGIHDLVLCARSRVLAVWCRSGETLVWEFSTVGREAAVKVRLQTFGDKMCLLPVEGPLS